MMYVAKIFDGKKQIENQSKAKQHQKTDHQKDHHCCWNLTEKMATYSGEKIDYTRKI